MKCIVVKPPTGDACGAEATWIVTFHGGDTAPACANCALYLGEIIHGIKTEKIKQKAPSGA